MRYYAFALLLFFSSACGQDGETNRCESVVCLQGFCDSKTGECANPDSCENALCVTGFRCEDDLCLPDTPCNASTPCQRGQCFDGGCINLDTCSASKDCLEGYACEQEQCVENVCADTICDRGLCDVLTGECVNKEICSSENQSENCIQGYYCYGQSCTEEKDICDDLNCARGVCDPAQAACVNDPTCPDDNACLENFFCEDGCQENKCIDGMCARGVCENISGLCINASPCSSPQECTDGFLCVVDQCLEIEKACGENGCDGNQICDYDSAALSASCSENLRCRRALDCLGERVCENNQCRPARACVNDALEPNETPNQATRISQSDDNFFEAVLCSGDVDQFTYDVNDASVFSGTLVVALQIDNIDIGSGEVHLKVTSPSGEIKEAFTNLPLTQARVEFSIGALDRGDYLIEILDASVEPSGLRYRIFAEVIETITNQACAIPTLLRKGQPINANTNDAASSALGSTCTEIDNSAGEDIYLFTLQNHSRVLIDLDPTNNADLSFSISKICENTSAPLECVEENGPASNENLITFLDEGSYYLIVQGRQQNSGGPYTLTFNAEETVCQFGEAVCQTDHLSKFCSANQTDFQTRTCMAGCDPLTGFCSDEVGENCNNPIDATMGYSGSVIYAPFADDYQIPAGGCLPDRNGSTSTDGPDVAYAVHLLSQQILIATLQTTDRFENTSLYLISQCDDPSTSCLAGSNRYFSTEESLTYKNETQNAIDLFVVADVDKSDNYGPTTISILVEDLICTPDSTRCAQNNVEKCNPLGTAYETLLCTAGCDPNVGNCLPPTNDTCLSAIPLNAPATISGRIEEFTNTYTPPSSCTGSATFGSDAVYSFSTTDSGKVAQVRIDAQFDSVLYIVQDCDNLDLCLGVDNRSASSEMLEFLVTPNTTYYIIVDSGSSLALGEFTLSFILETPQCAPNQIGACQTTQDLSFCSPLGIVNTHTCSGGCANDKCTNGNGDSCFETIPASTGQYTGTFTGSNAISFSNLNEGQCQLSGRKRGNDTIYEVQMNAGDSLFADLISSSSASLYLLDSCLDTSTCIDNVSSLNPSLSYTATVDQRVFLVVDRDSSFSSNTYTLDLRIGPPDCIPGSPSICNVGNSKIIYCDSLGFSREYDCMGNCTDGHCDAPRGDHCIDAIPMVDGQIETSLSGNNNTYDIGGPKNGLCRSASESSTLGKDTTYSIDLNAGDFLEATLETQSSAAQFFLIRDCEDLSTCLATNPQRGAGTISYLADTPQTIFIIVDSTSIFSSSYTLKTRIRSGLTCEPNASYCVGNSVEICNQLGTGSRNGFTCPNGCVEGGCDINPAADLCLNAPLTNGTFIYDSLANYTNDFSAKPICSGITGAGPDVSYQVQLVAGEVFHAKVQSYGKETLSLSLVRDCSGNTCLDGARSDSKGSSEIFFAAQQSENALLVVDSLSSANDHFSLLVESLSPQCNPGNSPIVCQGDALRFCNSLELYEYFQCDGSCSNAQCQNPSGESCIDPLPITNSIKLSDQSFSALNLIELSGSEGACIHNLATQGYEKIYALQLRANDTVEIQYTSPSTSTLMYLLADCTDAQSCLQTTGSAARNGFLVHQALADETIFLVLDRIASGATSLRFSLDIQFRQSCNILDPPTCIDATTMMGCASDGLTLQSDCGGACVNGNCATPTGQFCSDPIPLIDGSSDTRRFDKTDSVVAEGVLGMCSFPTPTKGKNYIYSIDLVAGQTLNLDYISDDPSTVIYLLTDCLNLSSCSAQDSGRTGRISYTALQDETLFVIMDGENAAGMGTYTLTTQIFTPNCSIGNMPTCSALDEISYCADRLLRTSICASCVNATCPTPEANNCVDVIPTTDGALIQGDFVGDDALTMQGIVGACNFINPTNGVDHFYNISLLSGQTLTATYSSNSSLAILYVMGSCYDSTTCYDNTSSSQTGSLTYTAGQDEDVVLVIDRTTSGSTSTFTYDLSVTVN